MRSSKHSTLPSSRNAFSVSFLQRIGERDEPPLAGEADAAGPWRVELIPGEGFGVFREEESLERGFRPAAVFRRRSAALMAAAVLPGTGREAIYRLQKTSGPSGFGIEEGAGELAGHAGLFDEALVEALNVAEMMARSPASLAGFLEAAGQVALERAGAILDARVG